ncbi:MAG TPA: radical SAM family heme chaperone HemW [Gemmatimonadaceae bacterium]
MVRHVYVHVPFCARRCSYCDFAIAVRRSVPVEDYLAALELEVRLRGFAGSTEVDTIYLGGGTPSRLGANGVARLLDRLRRWWRPVPGAEITLEANPEDVNRADAAAWREAGVTRVSLGAQSFDDRVLAWMHRTHEARAIALAAEALHAAGYQDWSIDLIFGLPAELGRDWGRDLAQALALAPPHVSCYALTLEPQTPLARWRDRGEMQEPDEGGAADEFLEAHRTLTAAGYRHYEVSNYAQPGHEARHNSAYWTRVPYVGIGPSAHSFDGTIRRWNEREYSNWVRRAGAGEDPVGGTEHLTEAQRALEEIYLGLRTTFGVRMGESDRPLVESWRAEGWAEIADGRVRLTAEGWLRLDALVAALTSFRSRL